MPRRRLDGESHGFEPADELTNVLPHFRPGVRMGSGCQRKAAARAVYAERAFALAA
jgi:hypothetical protein